MRDRLRDRITSNTGLVDPTGRPIASSGVWKGARNDRQQTKGWVLGTAGSADADIVDDLPSLRRRSRQLLRDNPLAGGAINTACKSVVGTGLNLRSEVDREILGWDEDKAIEWQRKAEQLFSLWARNSACDMEMTQDFWELQDLAFRSTLESGDALALFCYRKHPSSPFGLAVQIVEGDRICTPTGKSDGTNLVAGVVIDGNGAPVSYWVADQHPGARSTGAKRTWSSKPAFSPSGRRIAKHLFFRMRPHQHRGIPYLAPVIETLKELGEYTDGELRAAVISGLYTVNVTNPGGTVDPVTGEPVVPAELEEGASGEEQEFHLGYGAINILEPGQKIESTTPGRPNVAFDPFVLAMLRQVGVALEIPYEILIQHFTASYSAARAALLELAKFIRKRRAWLAAHFCQPVFEAFLEEAVALRLIEAPGFFDDPMKRLAYCGASWGGDSLGQIDIKKEADGWKTMVDENFAAKADASAALLGGDWDRTLERRAYEHKREKELGLLPAPAPAPAALATKAVEPPPQEPEQDGTDKENQ